MDDSDEDILLITYLNILCEYYENNHGKEEVKSELFSELLNGIILYPFSTNNTSDSVVYPPKCKGTNSVQSGLKLLQLLCKNSPKRVKILCDILHKKFSEEKVESSKKESDNYITGFSRYHTKSSTGYVGLRNRACLCYMNSSIQQLYMIPKFRKAILSLDFPVPEDPEHDLVYQLQRLFSYLQESEEMDYDTYELVRALKNSDGSTINPVEQQDANEFVSSLLQQLESALSGTKYDKLLDDLFGGSLASELIATSKINPEKKLHSIHSDPILFLSLDVFKINNIKESLESFISGDNVEYKWEETNETLDTIKRASIKTLPPCLIITLKRFIFDYDTFQNVKVNSKFEFPLELNMKPYTLEGREDDNVIDEESSKRSDDYYRYKLHGVVIHAGTANYGHYYSYINNRINENWYEFNDSYVGTFDLNTLDHECFGGEDTDSRYYQSEKTRNAFILFYDRIDEYENKNTSMSDSLNELYYGGSLASRRVKLEKEKRLQKLQKFQIPKHFKDEIDKNNKTIIADRISSQMMNDSNYVDNLSSLIYDVIKCNVCDKESMKSISLLALSFVFKEYKDNSNWVKILTESINVNNRELCNTLFDVYLIIIRNF